MELVRCSATVHGICNVIVIMRDPECPAVKVVCCHHVRFAHNHAVHREGIRLKPDTGIVSCHCVQHDRLFLREVDDLHLFRFRLRHIVQGHADGYTVFRFDLLFTGPDLNVKEPRISRGFFAGRLQRFLQQGFVPSVFRQDFADRQVRVHGDSGILLIGDGDIVGTSVCGDHFLGDLRGLHKTVDGETVS